MQQSRRTKKRRRPSGEPPPLPRDPGYRGWIWATAGLLTIGALISLALRRVDAIAEFGGEVLEAFARHRSDALTDVAEALNALTIPWVVLAIRLGLVIGLLLLRRPRHAIVALVAFVIADWFSNVLLTAPRPTPDVTVLGEVDGWFFPSWVVTALAVTLTSACMSILPGGRVRTWGLSLAGALLVAVAFAQMYLAADYPADALYAVALGLVVGVVAFRTATPDEVYPISYGTPSSKGAHLDLGPRIEATRTAMADQLGLTVTDIEPFGLEGSGGSSPLRMRVEEVDGWLFGKLYSTSHVRADRWYRLARTVMYGRLEDEAPFTSVRRLVGYEDYALRVMRDAGIRVAETYGVVELTPQVEYMLVQEFFEGSTALTKADVDPSIIDQGFELIRAMWDNGIAHRDIKPANMVVKDGRLQIVDVSGVSIRPSPWRQAVDLGNMCLVMALRSDPDLVYERALRTFTPDELAEAFASLQGMAIATQTSALLKEDGRPLLERFRELAPAREAVSIQRWSVRRMALAATVVFGALFGLSLAVDAIVAGFD